MAPALIFCQTLPIDCLPCRNVNFEVKRGGLSFRLGAALPSMRIKYLLRYLENDSY